MKGEQCDQNKLHKMKKLRLRQQELNCIISSDDDLPDEHNCILFWVLCDQTCFCLNVTDGNTHGV